MGGPVDLSNLRTGGGLGLALERDLEAADRALSFGAFDGEVSLAERGELAGEVEADAEASVEVAGSV